MGRVKDNEREKERAFSMPQRSDLLGESKIQRVFIENIRPEVDKGRFAIKRCIGDEVEVTADVFGDGHDVLKVVLLHRNVGEENWQQVLMQPLGNDVYRGSFFVTEIGRHEYTVEAGIDFFESWLRDLIKKFDAAQDISSELLEGAEMTRSAAHSMQKQEAQWLREQADLLAGGDDQVALVQIARSEAFRKSMSLSSDRSLFAHYDRILPIAVERERARFGAWYEIFPRSSGTEAGRHGTFQDCEKWLPYISGMGFNVLYLAPIHPIGESYRKGPNNTLTSGSADPGSPWAIGSKEGGHKAVHSQLGSLADFDHFLKEAAKRNLEIAMDIAFQCSPDHPYVRKHPEWFRHRPDGTIKYAENPPKKYQDIYPFDFECEDWKNLWQELKDVILFWIQRGVKIFRVDNPHTKPFRFWEWLISEIQNLHPDTIFLSEAFTRPKIMRYLAKCGFSQSYTYFTWRNTKQEIIDYFQELTQSDVREYLRPNLFANTPDILHEYLQTGGRPAFQIRLILAATLGSSYGIYGPAYELCETRSLPGTEEYLDSEKYQLRLWDRNAKHSLQDLITKVNRIRKENPALHSDWSLRFHKSGSDQILCYSKTTQDGSNIILTVLNLDPHQSHSASLELNLQELSIDDASPYRVHDLLSGKSFLWRGATNHVELDPQDCPAYIFQIHRKIKTERDFDYFSM
jgi:starch synthase (maltosyl-transferring)